MTSPLQWFLRCIRNALSAVAITWSVLFVANRLFIFQDVYDASIIKQKRHIWLLESCMDREFELNMQSHGDLCAKARQQKLQDPFTLALHTVFDFSRPCGADSCEQVFRRSVDTVGLPILIMFTVVIPVCLGKFLGYIFQLTNRRNDDSSPIYREDCQFKLTLSNERGMQGLPRAGIKYRGNRTFVERNVYLLESNVI